MGMSPGGDDMADRTRAARWFLLAVGVVLCAYALPFPAAPELLGRLVELEYTGPNAFVEVRSFYGGLELGMAVFFIRAASRPPMMRTALVAFTLIFGCAGLARAWGVVQYGFSDPSQPVVAGIEIVAAGAAVWLRRGLPEGRTA
jgi:hypothetical protein